LLVRGRSWTCRTLGTDIASRQFWGGKNLAHLSEHPPQPLVDAVEARLTHAAGAEWQPLTGGRTNFAWKLEPAGKHDALVVKLYRGPAKNPLFPNDPKAEVRLLELLGPTGLTPRLICELVTPSGLCNVYSHIPGQAWISDCRIVGRLVKALHGQTPPQSLRQVPNGSQALHAKTLDILADCKQADQLAGFAPQGHVPASGARALLHGDIVPGNLIHNATGLHLIDWQCPAQGDPCEDIAIFLSPAMQFIYRGMPLKSDEIAEFFATYDTPGITDRYQSLAPWYHWRMAAYCQWQSENGRSDYAAARDLEIAALHRSLNP